MNSQELPPDADLKELFEESDIFDELITKYPEDTKYKANYSRYFKRWLDSMGIEEPDSGEVENPITSDPIQIDFGPNISSARKNNANFLMTRMPERHRRLLNHRGVKIYVDERADQSPGWAEYAAEEGITSTTRTSDNRELGDLSFYHKGRVFVSDASGHGSYNVYVHELAHALDYHYLGKDESGVDSYFSKEWPVGSGTYVRYSHLSNDPEFVAMHNTRIFPNTNILAYYRTGSSNSKTSGRAETFAEGYAAYVTGGREKLKELFKTYVTADMFIAILKKQGVID